MIVERAFFDPGLVMFAGLALLSTLLLIWAVPRPHASRALPASESAVAAVAIGVAAVLALWITGHPFGTAAAAAVVCGLWVAVRRAAPRLSSLGALEAALAPASLLWLAPWGYFLLRDQGFPHWMLATVAGSGIVGIALFGFGFAVRLVDDAVFTHSRWRRPTTAPPERIGADLPKVSIHVPCYAEPPEVVIQTLQRLAELRYPNFEVIVCDNNTPDEALWRPVQQYCAELNSRAGNRFRFIHVAPLKGAKAGALNYCLRHTAEDAELIAVVDADYLAEPAFLSRLTGFFADPNVGFVQTPHDYRRDGSAYQSMCYWEYMPPNKIGLASLNEYDCAYTIGTMCILRRSAIQAAGGWAEWCLTEDSEISVRIRALGYQGVYVNETFGRGLIPETFEDLKKQRFRWTAGPVQQLLAHWRLYLPTALGGSPALSGWVKLMEANRGLAPPAAAIAAVLGLVMAGVLAWMTATHRAPPIHLPDVFWLAGGLGAAAGLARLWRRYRLTGCSNVAAILGAETARLSLGFVKLIAAVAPLSGRPIHWWRTPKFQTGSSLARGLSATAPETILGLGSVLLALLPLGFVGLLGLHGAVLASAGSAMMAGAFLGAPLMAVLSEMRLRSLEGQGENRHIDEIVEPALPRAA